MFLVLPQIPPIIDEKLRGLNDPILSGHPRLKNGTVVDLSRASGSTSIPPGSNHHLHHNHHHHNPHRSDTFKCFAFECNCFVAYLLLGLMGFVIFWSILMLRVYLPERYWRWSYIWPSTRNPPQPQSSELNGLLASGDRS